LADVLLTHSYHLPYDSKQVRKMQPYAPLGTLYAATALEEKGISVAVFDSMLEEPHVKFASMLEKHRPRVVAVYEDDFNFLSKMCLTRMREVAWEIASAARAVNAVVIAHGSDSTDNPDLFLGNGFDYVLCGEAEETLALLCSSLLAGVEIPDLDGVVKRDANGRIFSSPMRLARNPAWAELPTPARDLIGLESYRAKWIEAHGYFSANMVSSRGCPYHCNWCAKPISGTKFHLRAAPAVAEEMRILKTDAKVEHIWFGDDVFGLDHRWLERFAQEVRERDALLPFKIQSRADLMTERNVRNLKGAGCVEVWMGVESGSQAVLDAMDKGLRLSNIFAARNRLQEAGIRACYFLQFGYPGETWSEVQQTVSMVRETRPDDIGISFSYPLPGTVFYDRVQAQLGQKRNWTDSDDLCIMFKAAYNTDFYRAVREALHAEVDSWHEKGIHNEARRRVDALWHRVEELEAVSRQPDAFVPSERIAIIPPSAISPVSRLAQPTEA
jgi:anaerobic magnesium-protoporphyrin IX monomethyl ester cyclase